MVEIRGGPIRTVIDPQKKPLDDRGLQVQLQITGEFFLSKHDDAQERNGQVCFINWMEVAVVLYSKIQWLHLMVRFAGAKRFTVHVACELQELVTYPADVIPS